MLLTHISDTNKCDRKKKEKKITFIVATYVYASSQAQHTHSARTKIPHISRANIYKALECIESIESYIECTLCIDCLEIVNCDFVGTRNKNYECSFGSSSCENAESLETHLFKCEL